MQLKLKRSHKISFKPAGIIIKGGDAALWLVELHAMNLNLKRVKVYPLPGTTANSTWGCLVLYATENSTTDIGRHAYCFPVHDLLFIPDRSIVYPQVHKAELSRLLGDKLHFLHPEIGMVELPDPIDWGRLISYPSATSPAIITPELAPFIPGRIKSFQVKSAAPEKTLESFDESHYSTKQKFNVKRLNPLERVKLFFYRQLFNGRDEKDGGQQGKTLLSLFKKIGKLFSKDSSRWFDRAEEDFKQLEERSQKHVDRLLQMLRQDPAQALQYAIPLDSDGVGRGQGFDSFSMIRRWLDFSLSGRFPEGNGRTAVIGDNAYALLHIQYTVTARNLVSQKDYHKAAFMYLKLLKDYAAAAEALEMGGYYSEAAAIHIKYTKNKRRAAESYERGAMFTEALELYKELSNDEKVGDIYMHLGREKDAFVYYQAMADTFLSGNQYLQGAAVYQNKMKNETLTQQTLLKGWRLKREPLKCIQQYFSTYHSDKALEAAINDIRLHDVDETNKKEFLMALEHQFETRPESGLFIKDMAYELIADLIRTKPEVASELRAFNAEDKHLRKDILRFKYHSLQEGKRKA